MVSFSMLLEGVISLLTRMQKALLEDVQPFLGPRAPGRTRMGAGEGPQHSNLTKQCPAPLMQLT